MLVAQKCDTFNIVDFVFQWKEVLPFKTSFPLIFLCVSLFFIISLYYILNFTNFVFLTTQFFYLKRGQPSDIFLVGLFY